MRYTAVRLSTCLPTLGELFCFLLGNTPRARCVDGGNTCGAKILYSYMYTYTQFDPGRFDRLVHGSLFMVHGQIRRVFCLLPNLSVRAFVYFIAALENVNQNCVHPN